MQLNPDVEQVRFDGKLAFHVDVPEPLMGVAVPSFLLQPLVENAIRHGHASSDGVPNQGCDTIPKLRRRRTP